MEKPVVYIIPGFKHSPQRKEYQTIAGFFKAKNFDVILVEIDWKYKTVSNWVEQFLTKYYKNENRKKYFFGFSYGAVVSFVASTKVDVEGQIICSLSPYFNEDLASLFKSWKKMIGKRRVENFSKLKMADLAPLVKAKTFLLYGTHEGRFIETRAKDTYKKLNCQKSLVDVFDAKHDIGNPEYIKQIQKVINSL